MKPGVIPRLCFHCHELKLFVLSNDPQHSHTVHGASPVDPTPPVSVAATSVTFEYTELVISITPPTTEIPVR